MNAAADWQAGNARYLSAALEWLRLRLLRLAVPVEEPSPPSAADQAQDTVVHRAPGRTPTRPVSFALEPPATNATLEQQIEDAAANMAAESQVEPPPALITLSQQLGLSRFERETLLLCAAIDLDTRVPALCARAQDDSGRPYPTFALALALFDQAAWEVLSPERPLRYWRLIEINQPGGQPLTASPLRADERIVNCIKGLNYIDDRLAPLFAALENSGASSDPPPSQTAVVELILRQWRQAATQLPIPAIQLSGPDAASKQLVAARAAAKLGRHLYRLMAEFLPSQAGDLETLARLWGRESLLLPLALYLDAQEVDSSEMHAPVNRFLSRTDGVFFLGVRESWPRLGRPNIVVDVTRPTATEQREAWATALGPDAADIPGRLASQFNLNVGAIRQIAQAVSAEVNNDQTSLGDQLWDECRLNARPRLDALAQRLDPKVTWDDLVLPADQIALLYQIAAQVGQRNKVYEEWGFARKMNRGLGISALFAGESGTGKTMAAEVIAEDLRLNLYRIDLSAVVSKYIGETEKNLRRLFDAAEDGGAILFFDEADALFGKRSEVKDSHDRYANIEINYLLQRMESYRGLAILATNMKSALDTAFMRRLRFIVSFPFPGTEDRKRMWRKVFPQTVPMTALDYARLARLNLTGGSIHNVALNAAFLAAQAGNHITMPLVLEAARSEFRKLDRPLNEADFHWLEPGAAAA